MLVRPSLERVVFYETKYSYMKVLHMYFTITCVLQLTYMGSMARREYTAYYTLFTVSQYTPSYTKSRVIPLFTDTKYTVSWTCSYGE